MAAETTGATYRQHAPYPQILADLVAACAYRPGWRVHLADIVRGQGSEGLTLVITTSTINAYRAGQMVAVNHFFPVPPAAYDERSWRRWLFDRFLRVERHECMEFFQIDGERPFAPSHGPGNDPYLIREIGSDEDQRTSFRGVLNEEVRHGS
jgi:hypothetical protein